jgi:hypothetical protein
MEVYLGILAKYVERLLGSDGVYRAAAPTPD